MIPQNTIAFLLLVCCLFLQDARCFQTISTNAPPKALLQQRNAQQRSAATTSLSMCICINCARVTNCAAYHFVETKHNQPHMTEHPTFTPRDGTPTIHVNIRSTSDQVVGQIYEEHQEETAKAEAEAAADRNNNGAADAPLTGKAVYDLSSSTTVEYDVVACKDFVEDQGCWVRNMPEEIRLANPDFVPT